jgi:signal transduction histidine kinase
MRFLDKLTGLSVSRSIVESHGGRLWGAPNGDGPGASFAFSIPLKRAESPPM